MEMRHSFEDHVKNCCAWHGCKFGDENCPVVKGMIGQSTSCNKCRQKHIKKFT